MKFLYEYRTRDNAVHSGIVSATTRDDAYAALKAKGVKPSRLAEAPGFFNKLFGKGKRWLVIAVLGALCLVLGAVAVHISHEARSTKHEAQSTMHVFDSPTRRYPIGDAAIIAEGIRTGWADVFESNGERFLASFAIPGEAPAVTSVPADALEASVLWAGRPRPAPPSLESRQIIAMVNGMRTELRQYLTDGGTTKGYANRLLRRQREEIGYYQRCKTEIETLIQRGASDAELEELVDTRNESLRKLGIKTLVLQDFKK